MTHRIINRADLDLYTAADCDETCGADSPRSRPIRPHSPALSRRWRC